MLGASLPPVINKIPVDAIRTKEGNHENWPVALHLFLLLMDKSERYGVQGEE